VWDNTTYFPDHDGISHDSFATKWTCRLYSMGYLITSSFKLASYQDATLQSDLTVYSRSLLDLAHVDRSRAMIPQNFAVRSSLSKYELNYSKLHKARKLRTSKGEYSSQNETVADRCGREGVLGASASFSIFSAFS
jgi:hypothetical protein